MTTTRKLLPDSFFCDISNRNYKYYNYKRTKSEKRTISCQNPHAFRFCSARFWRLSSRSRSHHCQIRQSIYPGPPIRTQRTGYPLVPPVGFCASLKMSAVGTHPGRRIFTRTGLEASDGVDLPGQRCRGLGWWAVKHLKQKSDRVGGPHACSIFPNESILQYFTNFQKRWHLVEHLRNESFHWSI